MRVKNNNDIRIAIIAAISVAACLLVFMDWPSVDIVLGTALVAAIIIAIIVVIKQSLFNNKEIVIIAILSLFMMVALPIGNVPDEPAHLQRIYSISTGQIFPSTGVAEIPENLVSEIGPYTTIFGLKDITDKALSEDTIKLGVSFATGIYPIINYIPQTIMMTVARLVTDNRIIVLYSARVGSWMVSMIMLYFAFRFLPYGKMELLFISILPISLQGLAGASADGMAFSAVSLLISYVLHLEEKREIANAFLIVLLAVLVTNLKFMYFPVIFLLLAIPKECFETKSVRIRLVAFLSALISIVIWWVICSLSFKSTTQEISSSGKIAFMLAAPVQFFISIIRTFWGNFDSYYAQLIGGSLGWFTVVVNRFINTLMLLFALILVVKNTSYKVSVSKRTKRLILISIFFSIIIIAIMLWISYTPIESKTIWGIQGRYFLPLLFPLCVYLQVSRTLEYNADVFTVLSLDALAVASVLAQRLY